MKYALVTGGSRGIGRAICQRLAQEGYQVIINYASNQAEAEKTLELIGGQGELMPFDVADSRVRLWPTGSSATWRSISRYWSIMQASVATM